MPRWIRSFVLAALAASAPAAEAEPAGPFGDVPRSHWAYREVDRLERHGLFTGYPNGTFSGSRALTRYEFAVALQRLLQEANRQMGQRIGDGRSAWSWSTESRLRQAVIRKLGPVLKSGPLSADLLKLVREFRAELAMLGADVDTTARNLEHVRGREDQVEVPPRSKQENRWQLEGVKQARRDWEQGNVVLYQGGGFGTIPGLDPVLGIPCRSRGGCIRDERMEQQLTAYNEEIYRLVLEHGLPASSHRPRAPDKALARD